MTVIMTTVTNHLKCNCITRERRIAMNKAMNLDSAEYAIYHEKYMKKRTSHYF